MSEREAPLSDIMRVVPPAAISAVAQSESSIAVTWVYHSGGGQTATRLKWDIDGTVMGEIDLPIRLVRHSLTGLNPNTRYRICAFGLKDDEESALSRDATATTKPASLVPTSPTHLTATPSRNSMALTWSGPANASSYKISFGLALSGPVLDTKVSLSTNHTISGLASGTGYYFDVRSSNNIGDSPPTRLVKQTLQVPAMPTDLRATSAVTTMELQWSASTGADDYVIRYGAEPDGETSTVITEHVRETLTGLIKNTLYFFEVNARNHNGESDRPARITQKTLDGPPLPSKPGTPQAVVSFDKVTVGWAANAASNWEMAYGLPDQHPTAIGRYETNRPGYVLSYLAPDTSYFIEVRAFNESGYSLPSSTIVTIGPDRTQPRNLRNPGRTFSEAWLTWDRPEDSSYLIDYEITCPGRPTVHTTMREYIATGLVAGVEYAFQVQPRRPEGPLAARPASINVTTHDRVPPTRPKGVRLTPVVTDSARLEWDASQDNVRVTGYEVRRNNGNWTSVSGTSHPVTGFIAGVTDIFEVKAKDAAGNLSLPAITKFTTGNTSNPPRNLRITANENRTVSIAWDAPLGQGPIGYRVSVLFRPTDITVLHHTLFNMIVGLPVNIGVRSRFPGGVLSDPVYIDVVPKP
ncbi:fibronectin type III domain-containing protein [Pseudomonas sp. Sample_22]|uniref:fibronectin type III domain-containing protein n=1 Tax=Pseudomonas sp. Sample_22 TaxID=2448266 RepID=UPI001032CE15|nr:fibronectin type III domain-containing protein [Pseudomonas sp. Sample_22]